MHLNLPLYPFGELIMSQDMYSVMRSMAARGNGYLPCVADLDIDSMCSQPHLTRRSRRHSPLTLTHVFPECNLLNICAGGSASLLRPARTKSSTTQELRK